MLNKNGFSLIEAVIAGALAAIACLVVVQLLSVQTTMTAFQKKKDILRVVIEENAYEAETRSISQVPEIGKCLVRTYDIQGKWLTDTTVNATDPSCQTVVPTAKGAQIFWISSASDSINVTFNPANFLKLPKYTNLVRKVRILGGLRTENSETAEVSLTVYKR